ncbi:sensor histidine kinase [Saccharopolyspora sp. MS10]|uniref:sensor histidine kinase n=1 Tax=Saccharopolyspora sp. MS10 TaxID=3385973 RepID=UPI0039A29041
MAIGLVAVSESVGVGLLGAAVLRLLRRHSLGLSLIVVVVTTVCAMNISAITMVFVMRSAQVPLGAHLAVNYVAGCVSIGIGVLLARSVVAGSRRLTDATRAFGHDQEFRLPEEPPTAELAELAWELHTTSEKLAQSRKREQAAEASRRKLVAWISHDLRSPLARLRAMTESIEDGVAEDLPEYCRKIRADADRLTGMVDDLFELSRIQAGALRLNPREVSLEDLVSDAAAGIDVLAEQRGVRLRPGEIQPVPVRVDDKAMTRVFTNLLVNALQYSPEGTAVSVDVRAEDGRAVVLVSDECGGIPPDSLNSVFDMGWRGDAPRKRPGGGLGLAIVQGIVQAHGGTIAVRNVPGGCCFDVRLPLALR